MGVWTDLMRDGGEIEACFCFVESHFIAGTLREKNKKCVLQESGLRVDMQCRHSVLLGKQASLAGLQVIAAALARHNFPGAKHAATSWGLATSMWMCRYPSGQDKRIGP